MKSSSFGWWIGALSLIAIVIFQWLVLGFHATTIADTWANFAYLDTHPASPLWDQTSRPLTYLPWVIAYALSSETLNGVTALLITFFAAQAVSLYGLLRRLLPGNPVLTYCIAAVFVLYPADTGLTYDGAINIHMALFFCLLSVWLLLVYWDTSQPILLLPIALLQAACMLIYEASYPLIFATPLLLLFKSPRLDRRLLRVAGIWYAAPLLVLARTVVVFLTNRQFGDYQSFLLTQRQVDNPILDMLVSVIRLFPRHFLETWQDAIYYSPFQPTSSLFQTAAVTGMLALVTALLLIPSEKPRQHSMRRYTALLIIGFAALVLGFLAYLPTSARYDSFRVFIFTRVGAAISLVTGFYIVCALFRRFRLPVFVVISALSVSLASIRFLDLMRSMMESSLNQQRIAEQIIARMPSVDPGTDILLYDTPGVTNGGQDIFFGLSLNLNSVLRIFYHDSSITGHLCLPDGVARGGGNERCELYSSEYTIFSNDEPVFTRAYSDIVVFRMVTGFPEYRIELMTELPPPASSDAGYDPYQYIDPDADYPSRYHTMIDRTPLIDRK